MTNKKQVYIWLPLCIALGIGIGIFIGNMFSPFSSNQGFFNTSTNKMQALLGYIDKAYVDTVDVNELIEEAIPFIIEGLDPHSTYISAKEMEVSGDQLEGHFSGIGVEFMILSDTITIVNVIHGGPSDAVGLVAGDKIVSVNDSLFVGKNVQNDKVLHKLRGKKDTKVKLGIKRSNQKGIIPFELTRADVPVKSVDTAYKIDEKIGYIKVGLFGATTYNEFITAIAKLKAQGCESFIIDLQQNTGGYMNAATMMVNEFLNKNELIVYTEGRADARKEVRADGSGTCKTNQLIVLIDETSASASEIFAGAIQDTDRGLVIGRRSFGKGLVQNQFVFADKSAMRLTIARYHTPSGRCIQKAYTKGKGEEYQQDLMNRYLRGELDNKDSIKTENLPIFKTTAGRTVYGFDGIMPDIFIPRDTIGQNSYYISILNSGILRDFSFRYAEQNRTKLNSFHSWKEAANYLVTQNLLDNLTSFAEANKGIRKRPYLIEESRVLLETQLQALIIRYVYGDDGFYPLIHKNDHSLKQAISLLKAKKATAQAVRKQEYKIKGKP